MMTVWPLQEPSDRELPSNVALEHAAAATGTSPEATASLGPKGENED